MQQLDELYRQESRRVLATLIRLLGDFDLAEEALHEAFAAALNQWPQTGVPANPRAWLVSTGRFKAIDRLRRRSRHDEILTELQQTAEQETTSDLADEAVEDDRLRLIFTCCHPALSTDAQLALTLREVCGLTTEEVARAFLARPSTIAQRIVRAKNKIRDARIPYEVPAGPQLHERLQSVLAVVYLLYNEGYAASAGDQLQRQSLSREAIDLGRLLGQLLPQPEVMGLLALMLLQDARSAARVAAGELITLEDQDRSLWDQAQIREGIALVEQALPRPGMGPYCLQAAIAAVHAEAATYADTDWAQILALYDLLYRLTPTPVVALNRAVALAMVHGPEAGLELIDPLLEDLAPRGYHLAYAARAELNRRLGRYEQARQDYEQALALVQQAPEQRHLERQLASLPTAGTQ